MLFPAPGTGRGAVVAVLLGAVAVACMLGQHMRARDALLGKGDEWIAKEDSMALDVADEMAKRSLQRSQQDLVQVGGRGRSANRGLGGSMQGLQEEGKAIKLQLKADNDRARLERSRAHLLRMRAADDTDIARSSLDKVVSLDKQLALIKHQAQTARAGFGSASKVILASSQAHTKLLKDAARVTAKVKSLRKKITKLVADSHAAKMKAAADKDEEDQVQEDLSSALVRRNRREKRVAEERRRLDRLELDDKAADAAAAAKLEAASSEHDIANKDLRQLQNKFQNPKGAAVHH